MNSDNDDTILISKVQLEECHRVVAALRQAQDALRVREISRADLRAIIQQQEAVISKLTAERDAAWQAQADLVETRTSLRNSEACRAQAEKMYNQLLAKGA